MLFHTTSRTIQEKEHNDADPYRIQNYCKLCFVLFCILQRQKCGDVQKFYIVIIIVVYGVNDGVIIIIIQKFLVYILKTLLTLLCFVAWQVFKVRRYYRQQRALL